MEQIVPTRRCCGLRGGNPATRGGAVRGARGAGAGARRPRPGACGGAVPGSGRVPRAASTAPRFRRSPGSGRVRPWHPPCPRFGARSAHRGGQHTPRRHETRPGTADRPDALQVRTRPAPTPRFRAAPPVRGTFRAPGRATHAPKARNAPRTSTANRPHGLHVPARGEGSPTSPGSAQLSPGPGRLPAVRGTFHASGHAPRTGAGTTRPEDTKRAPKPGKGRHRPPRPRNAERPRPAGAGTGPFSRTPRITSRRPPGG